MTESFSKIQSEVNQEIYELTGRTIKELTKIWTELYEPSVCEDNIRVLARHVETFYKEILIETEEKKSQIQDDIKDLKEEALKLRRLLKIDIRVEPDGNVPLFTSKFKLDESLEDLRELLKKRKNEIYKLRLEQEELCDELNEPKKELLDDPLPNENELNEFRLHLQNLRVIKEQRIEEIAYLRQNIKRLLKDLEIFSPPEDENWILNSDPQLLLSIDMICKIRTMNDFYTQQMIEMKNQIDEMIRKIKSLWSCLSYDAEHMNKFEKYYNKYTQTTYDKFYQELQRLQDEKRKNIKMFIDKLRVEIYEWWEICLKSDIERKRFTNFINECYTEDLLALHEIELDELKQFYEDNKKIFQLYEERNKLWNQMIALEAQASEPGRLNNRGGKLLQEEKERKAVATKLPKIEEKLKELVLEYEEKNKRKFTVYGENILELMEKQWEQRREEKEKMMSARKNAIVTRTPLSAKNQITTTSSTLKRAMSIRNMSSVPASLHKRPLTDKSPNPKAKRKLLNISPTSMMQSPKRLSGIKSSAHKSKKRVIATVIKRQSGRYSNNRRNRRRTRSSKQIPKITVTDDTMPSDSTSYDIFQQRIEKDPSSRSSVALKDTFVKKLPTPRLTRSRAAGKVLSRLPTPKKPLRPLTTVQQGSTTTTELSRANTATSPMAGPSMLSRKLTPKEVPILF